MFSKQPTKDAPDTITGTATSRIWEITNTANDGQNQREVVVQHDVTNYIEWYNSRMIGTELRGTTHSESEIGQTAHDSSEMNNST